MTRRSQGLLFVCLLGFVCGIFFARASQFVRAATNTGPSANIRALVLPLDDVPRNGLERDIDILCSHLIHQASCRMTGEDKEAVRDVLDSVPEKFR